MRKVTSLPRQTDLVTLEYKLSAGNDREGPRATMDDEIAVLIVVQVNLTRDIRWQNNVGVSHKPKARRGRHVAKISGHFFLILGSC